MRAKINRLELAQTWHRLAQIHRRTVFGARHEATIPLHLAEDASWPFPGHVGRDYRQGGLVLLLINPGGGGDAYRVRTPQDDLFYPLLHRFREASLAAAPTLFEDLMASYQTQLQTWNVWRIVNPALQSARESLETVAVLNVVPFRTRRDRKPPVTASREAWRLLVTPALELLEPKHLVALGRKAADVVRREYIGSAEVHVVPRTIGDTYLSDSARLALDHLVRRVG